MKQLASPAQLKGHLCPHSGSFCIQFLHFCSYLEPIGGAKPKFAQRTDGLKQLQKLNDAISLTCPAQGSPLPSFR